VYWDRGSPPTQQQLLLNKVMASNIQLTTQGDQARMRDAPEGVAVLGSSHDTRNIPHQNDTGKRNIQGTASPSASTEHSVSADYASTSLNSSTDSTDTGYVDNSYLSDSSDSDYTDTKDTRNSTAIELPDEPSQQTDDELLDELSSTNTEIGRLGFSFFASLTLSPSTSQANRVLVPESPIGFFQGDCPTLTLTPIPLNQSSIYPTDPLPSQTAGEVRRQSETAMVMCPETPPDTHPPTTTSTAHPQGKEAPLPPSESPPLKLDFG
jgi:hypothetical protein